MQNLQYYHFSINFFGPSLKKKNSVYVGSKIPQITNRNKKSKSQSTLHDGRPKIMENHTATIHVYKGSKNGPKTFTPLEIYSHQLARRKST
jgi:hypothetical protein